MYRKVRLVAATLFFTLVTLLFLDFTGTIHTWFGWLAKIQFLPALLAFNIGMVLFLIILTWICGRIYCSIICPLGVFQDIISWMAGKRKKNRFHYSPALKWIRYSVLGIFIVTLIAGFQTFVSLIAPYSAYGRIVSNLFAPFWQWGNNVFAYFAERIGSYAFYQTDVWLKSLPTFIVAIATIIILMVLAWCNGRTYCNTICPVGTILGLISRYSIFRPVINKQDCNGCGVCARNCKASCIDPKAHKIDYSRCVVCMDCIGKCRQGAIRYVPRIPICPSTPADPKDYGRLDNNRRNFLSVSTLLASAVFLKAQEKKVDGGLARIENKKIPIRASSIVPPGSLSIRNFTNHCTTCQLCVSTCTNQVLRPSHNIMNFMQPEMSYERGYCRPECTKCSEVCPTGAIRPITPADKSAIQIGHAVWVKENCIVLTDGVSCGNCSRHCPTGAIQMVSTDPLSADPLLIPAVNTERCIGCGACENLCPARPFSAIYVEGHAMHKTI